MGIRPVSKLHDVARSGSEPFNIHLWEIRDCDGCEYSQTFAAGSNTVYDVEQTMQEEWYCRSCSRRRERTREQRQRTLAAHQEVGL